MKSSVALLALLVVVFSFGVNAEYCSAGTFCPEGFYCCSPYTCCPYAYYCCNSGLSCCGYPFLSLLSDSSGKTVQAVKTTIAD